MFGKRWLKKYLKRCIYAFVMKFDSWQIKIYITGNNQSFCFKLFYEQVTTFSRILWTLYHIMKYSFLTKEIHYLTININKQGINIFFKVKYPTKNIHFTQTEQAMHRWADPPNNVQTLSPNQPKFMGIANMKW